MDKKKLEEFRLLTEAYVNAEREHTNFIMSFLNDFVPGKNIMSTKVMTSNDLKKMQEMSNKVNELEAEYNTMAREIWNSK